VITTWSSTLSHASLGRRHAGIDARRDAHDRHAAGPERLERSTLVADDRFVAHHPHAQARERRVDIAG
jgi:hypothetical protein